MGEVPIVLTAKLLRRAYPTLLLNGTAHNLASLGALRAQIPTLLGGGGAGHHSGTGVGVAIAAPVAVLVCRSVPAV